MGSGALLPPSTDPIIALIQKAILPTRLALPKVPFGVPVPVQSALGTYAWVLPEHAEAGQPDRLDGGDEFARKVSGIVALSRELVKIRVEAGRS